jgi:parallel beta helix pectate lyase-like protein
MTSKIRSLFLSSTIITVLLFSAVGTTAVYADDDTTADTPTAETGRGEDTSEEATSVPEATATAEPAAKEGTATEVPATDSVEATATPEATATGEPVAPAEDGTPSDPQQTETVVTTVEETAPPAETSILEKVPENTTVSVLDASGQPQPLATQDSANAIEVTSDPVWCPATQTTPTPGANGCTASFTSFDALLTELAGNPAYQQAGTIYVQQNAYAGGESTIDFNSYDLSNIQNFDLTVTGGWNTTTNVVDPANSSTFTAPIIIGSSTNPWGGSLTINNISISGTNGTGLTVYSQNNITLSNVQVSNSVNGSGAELDAGGFVNINNSNFERNRTAGAIIRAGGDVAIADTSLSNSGTARLQITGADITSAGSVSLFDVLANGNREVGVNIVADGRVAIGASFIGGSSFSGTTGLTTTTCPGQVGTFCGYGLQIVTPDSIDIQGVIANDNFLWGASLNAGQDVNIVDSIFNANSTNSPAFIDDTGLLITSGGNTSLNNVQANQNRLIGAVIDSVGTVSINNSTFSNNTGTTVSGTVTTFHGYGLQVTSLDSIFINNVTASNNFLFGAQLDAAGDVVVTNSFFDNNTTGSITDTLGYGLGITSGQSVFMETVSLNGNQLYGANIQATGDAFLDFITATNNGTNGVEVDATCTAINGGTFTGNGEYGISLTNPALDQVGSPVFGGNGLGDIFPTAPGACPVAVVGGNTGGGSTGTGTTGNSSGQSQLVSLSTIATGASTSFIGKGLGAMSLNGLFTSNLFTVSTSKSGSVTTVGIFTGKYAYIHSSSGLQIVLLQPVSYTGTWIGAGA